MGYGEEIGIKVMRTQEPLTGQGGILALCNSFRAMWGSTHA